MLYAGTWETSGGFAAAKPTLLAPVVVVDLSECFFNMEVVSCVDWHVSALTVVEQEADWHGGTDWT